MSTDSFTLGGASQSKKVVPGSTIHVTKSLRYLALVRCKPMGMLIRQPPLRGWKACTDIGMVGSHVHFASTNHAAYISPLPGAGHLTCILLHPMTTTHHPLRHLRQGCVESSNFSVQDLPPRPGDPFSNTQLHAALVKGTRSKP